MVTFTREDPENSQPGGLLAAAAPQTNEHQAPPKELEFVALEAVHLEKEIPQI